MILGNSAIHMLSELALGSEKVLKVEIKEVKEMLLKRILKVLYRFEIPGTLPTFNDYMGNAVPISLVRTRQSRTRKNSSSDAFQVMRLRLLILYVSI